VTAAGGAADRRLRSIEIVEDRTPDSRCDEGFLRVARLRLRNHYDDDSCSRVYDCDVVTRPGADAVVAVLFRIDRTRRVRVLLRDGPRAPLYLRENKRLVHPDPRRYTSVMELVAGIAEASDPPGDPGLRRRAATETEEETGLSVAPEEFALIGGESFASPGMGDEKLYFCAAAADVEGARPGRGDGSVMEECARIVTLELGEAIEACRTGAIPDMKTELGLLRLADHLGYIPQLGCFADELPPELRSRYARLGVPARRNEPTPEAGRPPRAPSRSG
jgi:ADP-ribose pyrophosphatase